MRGRDAELAAHVSPRRNRVIRALVDRFDLRQNERVRLPVDWRPREILPHEQATAAADHVDRQRHLQAADAEAGIRSECTFHGLRVFGDLDAQGAEPWGNRAVRDVGSLDDRRGWRRVQPLAGTDVGVPRKICFLN